MSLYNNLGLAGLDIVLPSHIYKGSTNAARDTSVSAPDRIPYATPPRTKTSGLAGRSPLGDKTLDLNLKSHNHQKSCKHVLPTYQGLEIDGPIGLCSPSPLFHPLPLIPPVSFNFPSFPNNINSIPSILDQPALQPSLPDLPSPSQVSSTSLQPISYPGVREPTGQDVHQNTCQSPVFQHPNSPYVPWEPPVRRQILRPLTPLSLLSGRYSRPLSRSGARAPEPFEIPDSDDTKISTRWRNLRQGLERNVKRVVKCFKMPFKVVNSRFACTTSVSSTSIQDMSQVHGGFDEPPSKPLSPPPPPRSKSPSIASFQSSDSATLATWLATRQRISLERDYEPESMMSLAQYDLNGSDTLVAGQIVNTVCGVPGCDLHTPYRAETKADPEHVNDADDLWFAQRCDTPFERELSQSQVSHSSSPVRSFPEHSLRIRRSESVAAQGSSYRKSTSSRGASPSPGSRRRETSMPGGWMFGV